MYPPPIFPQRLETAVELCAMKKEASLETVVPDAMYERVPSTAMYTVGEVRIVAPYLKVFGWPGIVGVMVVVEQVLRSHRLQSAAVFTGQ